MVTSYSTTVSKMKERKNTEMNSLFLRRKLDHTCIRRHRNHHHHVFRKLGLLNDDVDLEAIKESCTSDIGTIVALDIVCDLVSVTDFPLCLPKECTIEEMEDYFELKVVPYMDDDSMGSCTFDVKSTTSGASSVQMQNFFGLYSCLVGAAIATIVLLWH